MAEWFRSLPKTMFVALVLGAGVLFIVLSDPPRGICDSRMKAFLEANKGFIAPDPAKPKKSQRFEKLLEVCKSTNSVGGCFELFQSLRQMIKTSKLVGHECSGPLGGHAEFKKALQESLDLLTQIAWGSQPPSTPALKAGWLDASDLNLYCQLKELMVDVYGQGAWNGFMEPYFKSLPQAKSLPRAEVWSKMLFSVNCGMYL